MASWQGNTQTTQVRTPVDHYFYPPSNTGQSSAGDYLFANGQGRRDVNQPGSKPVGGKGNPRYDTDDVDHDGYSYHDDEPDGFAVEHKEKEKKKKTGNGQGKKQRSPPANGKGGYKTRGI